MEKENVEVFEDEEIVTLFDEDNKPIEFAEIACVEYEGSFYALLQPLDDIEDMEEDEVLVCLLQPQDDETEVITPVTDEALAEAVFNIYLKALADGESCGCDCENGECDGNCDCQNEEKGKCDCGCGCNDKK